MPCIFYVLFALVFFVAIVLNAGGIVPSEVIYALGLIALIFAIIEMAKVNKEHYRKDKNDKQNRPAKRA